jgi:cellulose synthase/poly-beta-1,6-N-acetylglucosamine synthase-like glycosyltransferase
MKISLIISFYKNFNALELIFKALSKQSFTDFEVLVSEDDNNTATPFFIENQQALYKFPIRHLNQEVDNGFRKNQMLNKSIQASKGEVLVFLDGDCIPHRYFLEAHAKSITEKQLCFGRRVMLDKKTTEELYISKDITRLSFFKLLKTDTTSLKYALYIPFITGIREKGIWGCNYGILKKHLVEINGFDEDYITAGVGEDVDIEWRLKAIGVKFKSIRFSALQFHLYHKENYTVVAINNGLNQLKEKQKAGNYYCKNGIFEK